MGLEDGVIVLLKGKEEPAGAGGVRRRCYWKVLNRRKGLAGAGGVKRQYTYVVLSINWTIY